MKVKIEELTPLEDYEQSLIGVISKFKELGITRDLPESVFNPLNLALNSLRIEYYRMIDK